MSISSNTAEIRQRITDAARRAGRDPGQIALMAVTKTNPPERIREAYAAGVRFFGENRVQEFQAKQPDLSDLRDAEWHLIGHLQSNKAGKAVELFSAIDSLDSLRLAQKLNAAAQELKKTLPLLIEINIGGEAAKTGVSPGSKDLEELLSAAPGFANLQFRGLMCIPPLADNPERSRPYFRKLHELREQIAARNLPAIEMRLLSMGMSHDFEIAIEEGSTCVRVGTAIFGERARV